MYVYIVITYFIFLIRWLFIFILFLSCHLILVMTYYELLFLRLQGKKNNNNYRLVIHSFNKYVYVGALTNQSGFTV